MTLWLRPEQVKAIDEHARRDAPREACGLLLGRGGEITGIVPARNIDPQPERGFIAAPEDLAAALTHAYREGLSLAAIYHSHPATPPIPSERDIREAHYPDALHLIIGLSGENPELSAWRIDGGRVSRVALFIQSDRPLPSAAEPARLRLSQRVAAIAAGLIAVAIVLVTAFALLPPPELPT